jgi:signal transduction histidine kinase
VFDRLWRGGSAGQTTGSGIGLAIGAELARAHRGSVQVTSEPGHGSRFSLLLPLRAGAQP